MPDGQRWANSGSGLQQQLPRAVWLGIDENGERIWYISTATNHSGACSFSHSQGHCKMLCFAQLLAGGLHMKRLLLGCAPFAALATIGSAAAADLPVRMPLKAAPMVRVFSWTGCYVGGYL